MNVLKLNEYITEKKSGNRITLYHGTKASFGKFDINFLNSGWGEQAYGYGFYFTDYYEAAKEYSRGGNVITVTVPDGKYLSYKGIRASEKRTIAEKFFKYYTEVDEYGKEAYPNMEAKKMFWDEECRYLMDCEDGGDIYGTIASLVGSDKETSMFLKSIGYIGIKFPGDNRMTGYKFTNYVIFDENDIEIVK